MDEQDLGEIVRRWMMAYLAQGHSSMPRPGAVCPFAKPALDIGAVDIRGIEVSAQHSERDVLAAARTALSEFVTCPEQAKKEVLRSLVLTFPGLLDRGHIIDSVHAMVKDEAVQAGMMIGQFHADCTEPSMRNPLFAVNRSPVPMLVIRHMTVHDILFLHENAEWFRVYDERFGHLYSGRRRIDPDFVAFYERASAEAGSTRRHRMA